jgi:hypothetical protein
LLSTGQAKAQKQHWQDLHISIGQQSESLIGQDSSLFIAHLLSQFALILVAAKVTVGKTVTV